MMEDSLPRDGANPFGIELLSQFGLILQPASRVADELKSWRAQLDGGVVVERARLNSFSDMAAHLEPFVLPGVSRWLVADVEFAPGWSLMLDNSALGTDAGALTYCCHATETNGMYASVQLVETHWPPDLSAAGATLSCYSRSVLPLWGVENIKQPRRWEFRAFGDASPLTSAGLPRRHARGAAKFSARDLFDALGRILCASPVRATSFLEACRSGYLVYVPTPRYAERMAFVDTLAQR
jgi:hypothetical protein